MSSKISRSLKATIPPHDDTANECSRFIVNHRHCHLCIDIVLVEGEGRYEYSIDPHEGAVCEQCSEVACASCMTSNTPTGERMCTKCADAERNEAQQADEIFRTLDRARAELESYHGLLTTERNPIKIQETLRTLQAIQDTVTVIRDEFHTNVERAYGHQLQLVPAC